MSPRAARLAGRITWALGVLAGVLLLLMTAITFVDVMGRYLFSRPMAISFELVQICMATLVFAALPLVTAEEGHVSMGLFVENLRGPIRTTQRLVAYGISAALSVLWGAWVWRTAGLLTGYGESLMFSGIPVGPFAYFIAVMIFLQAALMLLVAVIGPLDRV